MFFVLPYFVKHFVTCSLNRRFNSFTLDLLAYAEVAPDCERLGPLLDLGLLLDFGLLLDLLLLHDLGRTLRLALDPLRTRRVGARRFALRAPVFTLAKGAAGARQAAVFPLAVGAALAVHAVAFHIAVRAGLAHCTVLLQLAVRARFALHAGAFHPSVGTWTAHGAVAFRLPVRALLPWHDHRTNTTSCVSTAPLVVKSDDRDIFLIPRSCKMSARPMYRR